MARARLLVATLALATALPLASCTLPEAPGAEAPGTVVPATAAPKPVAPEIPAAVDKPNILLVMTDDMRADDVQWMPHTQGFFARRGTEFRNFFAPTPLCCPNRASYLTGQFAHNHQVWWHDAPWGYGAFDDSRTISGALQREGYRTAYIGKYLNRYGEAAPKADPGATPWTYVPDGWDEWRGTPDSVPVPLSNPLEGSTYNYYDTTVNVNGALEGHEGEYNSTVLVDETLEVLRGFEDEGRPWYVQLNSLAPHHGEPFEADDPLDPALMTPARPDAVKGAYDEQIPRGLGIPADGQSEVDTSDKARITRRLPPLTAVDRAGILASSRQRAETLLAFDQELVRVLRRLQRTGELDRTVVAFTSDNGFMQGEHRWKSGKVIGFEPSYRVPLLLAGPGVPVGTTSDLPASTVDLTASVLDWAGARLRGTDGVSFVDRLAGDQVWDRALGYEAFFPSVRRDPGVTGFENGASAVGIRTAGWFYVRYANGHEELFDLRRDPLELESVAADPAYAAQKAALGTVWDEFHTCRRAACDLPLPESLAVSARENHEITDHRGAEIERYYR